MKRIIIAYVSLVIIIITNYSCNNSKSNFILIKSADIIDGTGANIMLGYDILIRDSVIEEIGKKLKVPKRATIIDAKGKTIIPGLINMHAHFFNYDGSVFNNQFVTYTKLFLAGGVTSIFTPGDYKTSMSLKWKRDIEDGEKTGPRIFTAGIYIDDIISENSWFEKVANSEEAEKIFNKWKDSIDAVKVYTSITEEELKTLTRLAKENNKFVTGHLKSVSAKRAIELGINGIEHGLVSMSEFFGADTPGDSIVFKMKDFDTDCDKMDSLITKLVKKQVYINPTMIVFQSLTRKIKPMPTGYLKYICDSSKEYFKKNESVSKLPECEVESLDKFIEKQKKFIKKLHDRGGLIVAGTDIIEPYTLPGYAMHHELTEIESSGISVVDVIKICTSNPAKVLKKDHLIGSIEVGKLADLVIIDGDLTKEFSNISNVETVIKNGRIYNPDNLKKSAEGTFGKENLR